MRRVRWVVFPALLTGSVAGALAAMEAGLGPGHAGMAAILCAALPLLLLEGLDPFRQDWRRPLVRSGVDLVHLGLTGLATELFRAASFGLMIAAAAALSSTLGGTLWPSGWPMPLQLGLALVVGDLGAYWVHRIAHLGPLWTIHAMHHSSEKLSMLSSGRNHPLNAIAAYASQVIPLILLGAEIEVLAALSVFTAVHGMLQHANAELRHGWLNYVFATADVHRWHHSTDRAEENTNFGSNLVLWDHVFGTFALPHLDGPAQVGLDDVRMPDNVWVHLASPWTLSRWTVPAEPAPVSSGSSAG